MNAFEWRWTPLGRWSSVVEIFGQAMNQQYLADNYAMTRRLPSKFSNKEEKHIRTFKVKNKTDNFVQVISSMPLNLDQLVRFPRWASRISPSFSQ